MQLLRFVVGLVVFLPSSNNNFLKLPFDSIFKFFFKETKNIKVFQPILKWSLLGALFPKCSEVSVVMVQENQAAFRVSSKLGIIHVVLVLQSHNM